MSSVSGVMRYLARPTALAAAVLLAASGALASTRAIDSGADASAAVPAAGAAVDARAAVDVSVTGAPEVAVPATAAQRPAPAPTKVRPANDPSKDRPSKDPYGHRGDHGYSNSHSSWVQRDGLRLEIDTHSNEATAGSPHRMSIALTNLTDRPIALYGPNDCHLVVGAARAPERGEEKDERDQVWACASDGRDPRGDQDRPRTQDDRPDEHSDRPSKDRPENSNDRPNDSDRQGEEIVIGAGETIRHTVGITFTKAGNWAVWGMCACFEMHPQPEPKPEDKPEREPSVLDQVLNRSGDSYDRPHRYPHKGRGLVTPPIRMKVA